MNTQEGWEEKTRLEIERQMEVRGWVCPNKDYVLSELFTSFRQELARVREEEIKACEMSNSIQNSKTH